MKTPRFTGPFKWSALRNQLLSLREDIESARKVAGRYVRITEHPGKGTVIDVSDAEDRRASGIVVDCCPMSSIRLQVYVSGTIDPELTPPCATFDCAYDKTWTCPADFDCDPCSDNQELFENNIDNSDCMTCSSGLCGHVPWGVTHLSVSLHPFAAPPRIIAVANLSFHCGDSDTDNCCGVNIGDAGLTVAKDWLSADPRCPIGVYTESGSVTFAGFTCDFDFTITVT